MRNTHKKALGMFRRVRELLTTDTVDPSIAVPLEELDAVIARLSDHGIAQETLGRRTRSFTITLGEHARVLQRDLMRPAYLAARSVPPEHVSRGAALRTALRMPRHADDYEALVIAARAFANAVDEHAEVFAAAGLPRDVSSRMRAAADALLTIIDERAQAAQRRVAATKGVAEESRRGIALVRLLDALVEPALRAEPARLVEWQKATRVRSMALSTASTTAAADAPTAVPTAAPTAEHSRPPIAESEAQQRAA